MYLNVKLIEKKKFTLTEVIVMQVLKQNRSEDLEDTLALYFTDDIIERFENEGLLKQVKKKRKTDSEFSVMRLTTKGNKLLEELLTPEVEEQDKKVADWLSEYYKQAGKEVGNKKRLERHIRDFRVQSGIEKNNLIKLCTHFLQENEDKSNKLEFVFYYAKTVYATKFNLYDSWLYSHYLKNQDYFDNKIFENYDNN